MRQKGKTGIGGENPPARVDRDLALGNRLGSWEVQLAYREFLSWSAEFVYFDIYSGMAEFLQRSMTAKSREKQPSPLAPNGKLLIEMQRLKASGRLPSKYDATCIFVVSFHFLSTPSFSALERVRKGTG